MALVKSAPALLFGAGTNVPAGTLRSAPVIGVVNDVTAGYRGNATIQIANGASAPGQGCIVELQSSYDGVNAWSFLDQVIGDIQTSANFGGGSGSVPIGIEVKFIRAIAYGNTVNAVTVNGQYTQVTSL